MATIIGIAFIIIVVAGCVFGKGNDSGSSQRPRNKGSDNDNMGYPPSYYH